MANGDIHKLGTLYVNGIKRPLPIYPWSTNYVSSVRGDILEYNNIGGLIEIRDSDEDEKYKVCWVEVNDGDKKLLICDRNILVNVSWSQLNEQELVYGKEVTIDNNKYKIRLLSGGTNFINSGDAYGGGTPITNEWDRLVVNNGMINGLPLPLDSDLDSTLNSTDLNSIHNKIWNWFYCYSWCQDEFLANPGSKVIRGYFSCRMMNRHDDPNYITSSSGWRPVLELINSQPNFSFENDNLGEISYPLVKNYTVSDIDEDIINIVEKIDGTIIRTLENQRSGTEYKLNLTDRWDSISYGKHTIEIIATDTNGLSSTVTITFNKIKDPIETIPTTSSLKQAIAYSKEIEKEIDYQCFKLESILNEKRLDLNPSDKKSLSSLIYAIRRVIGPGSILTLDNMAPTKSAGFAVRNVKAPSTYNIHPVYYDEIKGDLYSLLLKQQDQSTTYFIKQDKEGAEVWRFLLSGANSRLGKTSMFMYKGYAILITIGKIYKIDLDTQEILQSFNITINDNMCYKVYNNKIYLITSTGILSYDLDTFEMIASIGGLKRISAGTSVAFLCDRIIICVDTSVRRIFDLDLNDIGTTSTTTISTNNLMSIGSKGKCAISVNGYTAYYFDKELNIIKSVQVSRATAGTSALRLLYSNNELAIVMGGNYGDSRYEQYTLAIDSNGGSHMYIPHHGFSEGYFINDGEFGYLGGNETNFNIYRTKTKFEVI